MNDVKGSVAPIAKTREGRRVPRSVGRPPWGRATSPAQRRRGKQFREILGNDALAGTGETRFGNAFGPQPREVRGCKSLLGITGEWVGSLVSYGRERFEIGKELDSKLEKMRNECKSDERYARALITLGDKILGAGKAPVITNVLLEEIVKELFTLTEMDTRCVAAFMCKVQLNASYISTETPIMVRILEGEGEIRSKPAFVGMAKRLLADLESTNETDRRWAEECCIALKIVESELRELIVKVDIS